MGSRDTKPDDAHTTGESPAEVVTTDRPVPARLWGALVLVLMVVLFVLQNTESTTVDFLFWSVEASLALVIMVTGVAFALVDQVVSFAWRRRRRQRRDLED
ncbi:MAG TPA: LapA family protein [Acidimicrobiales bacterium]|jgi:uncharacterized integral membrane protein